MAVFPVTKIVSGFLPSRIRLSFDISVAGTTVEGVSADDARTLLKVLQKLVQVKKKEVSNE